MFHIANLWNDLEAEKEHGRIASIIDRVNQKKFSELKDRYIHDAERELLPDHASEPAVPQKSTIKKSRSRKARPKQKSSRRKPFAGGVFSIDNPIVTWL